MSARIRKLGTIALLAGVFLLAAVVVVLLLSRTDAVERYVLRKGGEYLRAQGIELSAADLELELARPSVAIQKLELRSMDAPLLPPFLAAERAYLDLGLWKSVRGVLAVDEASLDDLRLHVVLDENGRDNLPGGEESAEPAPAGSGAPDFLVSRARIARGSVRFEDRARDILVEIPRYELALDGNAVSLDHALELSAEEPGQVVFRSASLALSRLALEGRLSPERLQVADMELGLGESRLSGEGSMRDFSAPEVDLDLRAALELDQLAELVRPGESIEGRLAASVSVEGPLEGLRVAGEVTGTNLGYESWPRGELALQAAWDSAAETVDVSRLSLSTAAGTLEGEGRVALAPGAGLSSLQAELRRIDLGALSEAAGAGTRIASVASGGLEARWPDVDFARADGRLEIDLDATRSEPANGVLPLSGTVVAEARDGWAEVRLAALDALGARVRGEVALDTRSQDFDFMRGTLDGALQVRASRLARVMEETGRLRGSFDRENEALLDGSAVAVVGIAGSPREPRIRIDLAANDVRLGELTGLRAGARADYDGSSVRLDHFEVRTEELALLSARGEVGLAGSDAPLRLRVEAQEVPIAPLLASASPQAPVTGEIFLDAAVSGTRAAPRGDFDLRLENLSAYGESFGRLVGEGLVEGQTLAEVALRLEKPRADGGSGSLVANGRFVPRTREYDLRLESEGLRLEGLELSQGAVVRGDLELSAAGSGTLDAPELQVELASPDLELDGRALGPLRLSSEVVDPSARVDVDWPRMSVSARSEIALEAPHPLSFEIFARSTDLSQLPIALEELEGRISATVSGSGSLEEPEASAVAIEVQELEVSFRDRLVRAEGPIRAGYRDRALTVDSASLVTGSSRLELQGVVPLDARSGSGAMRVSSDLLLEDFASFAPPESGLSFEGRLRIEGTVEGNLERLDPRLSVRMEGGSFDAPATAEPVTGIDFTAELANGVARWEELNAEMGPARVASRGEVPLSVFGADLPIAMDSESAPMRASLQVRDFRLSLLEAVPEKLEGVVSLELEAESSAPDLDRLSARLSFPDLTIDAGGYPIEQTATTSLSLRDGVLHIEQLEMAGDQTQLQASGTAALTGARALDLQASGFTELGALAAAMEDVQMAGTGRFEAAIAGTLDAPDLSGSVSLEDAQLAIEEPEVAATGLSAMVVFRDDRLIIEQIDGELNGGRLSVSGGARLQEGELAEVDVGIRTEDVYLEFPLELQTLSTADLRILSRDGGIVLGGEVRIQRGSYTERLEIEDEVLERLRSGGDPEIPENRSPLLARLRYDLDLRTIEPIVMDNNLAETALTFDLDLTGGYYRPGLTGRLDLEEGGEIRLRENTYVLERGTVSFLNETRIEPALDILARTEAGDYDVTLEVTGVAGDLETRLTSDPHLPEVDILALLATGRTLEEFRGEEIHVAQEQLLSYLAGRTAGRISPALEQSLGLSEVRIEPHLVSAESDPTARLTVGQEIAPDLRLVYSQNLTNSSDQIYIAEYEPTRRFTTMLTQQEDNSYRFDLRHRLFFGGGPESGHPSDRKRSGGDVPIGTVVFTGNEAISRERLADELDLESGDRYDFFEVRRAVKRLEDAYRELGFLEARIDLERSEGETGLDLAFPIEEGPRVQLVFTGDPVPSDVQDEVVRAWSDGFFDRQRASDATEVIRGYLRAKGHLEAEVESSIELPSAREKTIRFHVDAGPRYERVDLFLDGGEGIEASRTTELLEELDAEESIHVEPDRVTDALARLYESEGFLEVEVEEPRYELDPNSRSARVTIEIREGTAYAVGRVGVSGNTVFTEEELQEVIPLETSLPYRTQDRRDAIDAVERMYWDRGYNDVLVTPSLARRDEEAVVEVAFEIQEGRQEIVRDVVIAGTEQTTERFVRSQLVLEPGDVLDLDLLSSSRRNLYQTGAFATVEMEQEEGEADDGEEPVTIQVRVREVQPFSLYYGASYDTERGPGAIVDLVNQNSLGRARTLGVRGRYDGWLREARIYFSQPQLRNFPLKSNATVFYAREFLSRDEGQELVSTRAGLTFDQEIQLRNLYVFSAGYRYEWNEVSALVADSDLEGIVPAQITAPLTATLTRDSRDDLLDATRGTFQSQALELAPEFLGSDMGYVRYFGQYNAYWPLSEPTEVPWVGVFKTRLLYAASVRVGLAGGLGSPTVPVARRFFAGGGTSVRGFEHNALGPQTGGSALFITNHEIRFPLVSFFDGVGFLDLGNVYESVSDFDLGDLRETAGLGLRIRTPYFLIRLDYGFKLDRRPGESASSLFFSIGQAF